MILFRERNLLNTEEYAPVIYPRVFTTREQAMILALISYEPTPRQTEENADDESEEEYEDD